MTYLGLDSLALLLVIGFLAGITANAVMKHRTNSALTDVILGIMGAGVGGLILPFLGLYSLGGFLSTLISAIFGSILLIWFYRGFLNRQDSSPRS